jgi:hypothetical protein
MKRRLFFIASILVTSLSTGSLFAQSNIVHERFTEFDSYVDEGMCAFPVEVSSSTNLNYMIMFDAAGKPIRVLLTVNHALITFSANGKTLTARGSGGVDLEINPDGTREASTFGINLLMTIPHYGTVFLDAGHAEFLFSGGRHLLFQAGPAIYDMQAFCGELK